MHAYGIVQAAYCEEVVRDKLHYGMDLDLLFAE